MKIVKNIQVATYTIFCIYCCVFYLVPYCLFLVNGNPLELEFVWTPNYEFGLLFVLFSMFIFSLLYLIRAPVFVVSKSQLVLKGADKLFVQLYFWLALIYLCLSIFVFQKAGLGFRHSGVELNSLGGFGFLHLLLNEFLFVFTVAAITFVSISKQGYFDHKIIQLSAVFSFVGYLLSLQSAIGFIYCIAALHLVLAKYKYGDFERVNIQRLFKQGIFVFCGIIIPMVFFGSANKNEEGIDSFLTGFDGNLELLEYLGERFVYRLGFHFYSLSELVTNSFIDLELQFRAFKEQMNLIIYRLSLIAGFSFERPEIGSVARLNFLAMNASYLDRVGTTPSALGSIFYLPGGVMFLPIIMYVYYNIIYRVAIVSMASSGGSLPLFYALVMISAVLDSFLDTFNPFSTGFVSLVAIYIFSKFIKNNIDKIT